MESPTPITPPANNAPTGLPEGKPDPRSRTWFKAGNKAAAGIVRKKKVTVEIRELRERILNSWDAVDGDKLLKALAARQPALYARLILSCLPKDVNANAVLPSRLVCFVEDAPPPDWVPCSVRGNSATTNARVHDAIARQVRAMEEGGDDDTE